MLAVRLRGRPEQPLDLRRARVDADLLASGGEHLPVLLVQAKDFQLNCGQFRRPGEIRVMKVCIVGASGKLGQYMVAHALDRGYEVAGVCREQSVAELDAFPGRMTVIPGATDDRGVIAKAVAGCDRVQTVLAPRVSTGTRVGPLRRCSTTRRRERGRVRARGRGWRHEVVVPVVGHPQSAA
jgi:hypothetical protein